MTSLSQHRHHPACRREMLSNWLALLTLLALGIVWPSADAANLAELASDAPRAIAPC